MGSNNPISQPLSTRVTKFYLQIAIQPICSTLKSSLVVQPTLLTYQKLTQFKRRNLRNAQLLMMMKKSTLTMMTTTKLMENYGKTSQDVNEVDSRPTTTHLLSF
jgi:hypothetical protein